MKMSKFLRYLLLCFILCLTGCINTNDDRVVESKEPFTVQVFFSQTCPRCKLLRENYETRLQEEFGEQVSFIEYDIDTLESQEKYYEYIGIYDFENGKWSQEGLLQIENPDILCDENGEYCNETWIPFVVIGDMYAFIGYNNDYLEDYVQDVHLALQNKPLNSGYIRNGRLEFKE